MTRETSITLEDKLKGIKAGEIILIVAYPTCGKSVIISNDKNILNYFITKCVEN